jgi:osmoprotectant transport system substrate-binding protein
LTARRPQPAGGRRFSPALLAALLAAALFAGCGGSSHKAASTTNGKPPVRIGTKNFTEEFILGQLYAQALRAKGYRVELKNDIGSSEIVDRALTAGAIDMYPEYTGVIVQEIAHQKKRPRSASETYARARAFQAKRGFAVLDRTPGQDVLANAVRPQFARKHNLRTTADLRSIGPFTYGGPSENRTRFQGVVGMRQVYKLNNLRYVPLRIENRYQALERGKVDMIGAFTTEPQLRDTHKIKVLSDPAGIFGYQNVVPVIRRSVLDREGAAFSTTVNAVSDKLTNEVLRELNAAVDIDGHAPADVAREFLQRNGLL